LTVNERPIRGATTRRTSVPFGSWHLAISYVVAVGASVVPFAVWHSFAARFDDQGRLTGPFLSLAAAAVAVGLAHRRRLSWPGVAGLGVMVVGATAAVVAVQRGGDISFNDAFWRAHFVIMVGSLVVAATCFRFRAISRPAAVVALIVSWAFFGAWGVGLAWIAWALASSAAKELRQSR